MFVENYNHENLFFWSDLHLGHDKDFIYTPRAMHDVAMHDAILKKRIYEKVTPGSTFWLLGDTILGMDSEQRLFDFLSSLPCAEVVLMPGNHFSGVKQLRRSHGREFDAKDVHVRIVSNLEEIQVRDQLVVLSHYPLMSWNGAGKKNANSWMVHGHVHGRIKASLPTQFDGGKILDVGVESCAHPMSFAEIREIMSKKAFKQVDHHGAETK